MTFRFIYSQWEKNRIIPSVLIDSRADVVAINNKKGSDIKAYTDGVVAEIIDDSCLFYKIETESGNLVGYFVLKIDLRVADMSQYQLRPAFKIYDNQISQQIINFMQSGDWLLDYL